MFSLIGGTLDIFFDWLFSKHRSSDERLLYKLVRLLSSLEKAEFFHPLEKSSIGKYKSSVKAMIGLAVNCESIKNNEVG